MRSTSYMVLLGAVASSVSGDVVSTELHCVTAMGPKPVYGVQTVSSTSTVTLSEATSTTVVTDTVTAAPTTDVVTETAQVTVTQTENTVTDTFTSTSTETDTITTTTTQTDTLTETVTTTTTTTDTTVVPTPAGFLPISDTLAGYPQQKRRNVGHPHCKPKGSVYATTSAAAYLASSTKAEDCGVDPTGSTYAQSVACSETITEQHTATATATSSMTITAAPVTSTTTETVTSTSTEVPHAETTETLTETTTATATATQTETLTQTETVTETASAPTQTSYAACQASNLLSSYNGMSIVNVYNNNNGNVGGGSIYDNASAPSAEACCALCFNTAGCSGTAWLAPSRCVLLRNAARTCDSQSSNPAVFITGNGGGYTLSNSGCGYIKAPPS